mgnify:CR=1 FL=1
MSEFIIVSSVDDHFKFISRPSETYESGRLISDVTLLSVSNSDKPISVTNKLFITYLAFDLLVSDLALNSPVAPVIFLFTISD